MKTTNTYNITTYPQLKSFINKYGAQDMITTIRLRTWFRYSQDIDAQVLTVELFSKGHNEEQIEKEVRKKWEQDQMDIKLNRRKKQLLENGLPESLLNDDDAMRLADEWLSNRVSYPDVVDRILTLEDESAARDKTNRELTIEYFHGLDELEQERKRFNRNEYTA